MENITDSGRLKEIFKQAVIEAMEDLAMIHAIQQGEKTGPASRKTVFGILEGKAWKQRLPRALPRIWNDRPRTKNLLARIQEIILEIESVDSISAISNLKKLKSEG